MAARFDFLRLYEELGLAPDASLDDLKRAYRRRVSELHPDRHLDAADEVSRGAAERLQHLTVMYAAATDFHRQHGRLPGAQTIRRPAAVQATPSPTPPRTTRRHRSRTLAWLVLLVVAGLWLTTRPPAVDEATTGPIDSAPPPGTPLAGKPPPAARGLEVGMAAEQVLALEGEPVTRGSDRWGYGPSWIAFDKDNKVSEWYSSPLRPLKVARTRSRR